MLKAFVFALLTLPFFQSPVEASIIVFLRENEVSFMSKCNDDYGHFIVTDLKMYYVEENISANKQGAPDLNPRECGNYIFDTKNEFPDQPGRVPGREASDAILLMIKGLNNRGKAVSCPSQIMSVYKTASHETLIDACFE